MASVPDKPSPYMGDRRPMSMWSGDADTPPPLPQQRQPSRKSMRRRSLNASSENILNSHSGIPLSLLMDGADIKNSSPYPLSAKIVSGPSDTHQSGSDASYPEGNVLIHFEMKLKIVEVLFERGGTYQIPLCSANKFSVLHNPNNNMAQAMMGHYYETVGHMLAQHHKPKVVCVTRNCKTSSTRGSVQDGDILIIQRVQKNCIRCLNVVTNQEKRLADRCAGAFTTQPEKIKMSLKDICKNMTLPLKVIMYHQMPHIMTVRQNPITLLAEKWEESVIATNSLEAESAYGNIQLLRIVRDVGLHFQLENIDDASYLEHSKKSCIIYREFTYSMILHHLFCEDTVWPNHGEIQSSLYSHVDRMGDIDRFIQLKKPSKAFRTVAKRDTRRETWSGSTGKLNIISDDYQTLKPLSKEELSTSVIDPTTTVVVADEKTPPDDDLAMEDITTILHTVNTVNRQMMITVESLRAEVEGLKMDLKQTKKMMTSMRKDFTSKLDEVTYLCGGYVTMELGVDNAPPTDTQPETSVIKPPVTTKKPATKPKVTAAKLFNGTAKDGGDSKTESIEDICRMNIAVLNELNHPEVLQLLEKLQLVRCIPAFKRNQVTGTDLAKYDKNTLETELDIHEPSDIECLMEVVQGSPSKWKILES